MLVIGYGNGVARYDDDGVELIYEKVLIGANLSKNTENDDSVMSKYVKSHLKQLLY